MPVVTPALSASILSQFAGKGLTGTYTSNLSSAIATGTRGYLSSLIVQTLAVGTLGAGTGTGTFQLDPVTGTTILTNSLRGSSLVGENIPKMASAIAIGIASVINTTALVNTVVTGVAVGTGTGTFSNPNPKLATSLVFTGLTSNAIVGPQAGNLAQGLGQGLSQWFQTGLITTVIAGATVFPFNATTGAGVGTVS